MKLHSKFTQPIQNKVNQIKINQIICQWLIFDSTQLIFKIQQYKNANIANFINYMYTKTQVAHVRDMYASQKQLYIKYQFPASS